MDNKKSRLRGAIVYICHLFEDDPLKLGTVKLNKILWFSDVESLDKYGKTISGELEYTAQDHGPVITTIPSIMSELKKEGIVYSNRFDFGEYQQWVYSIINRGDAQKIIEILDKRDKEILKKWADYAHEHSVREIVAKAHKYDWWDSIKNGNTVPVHLGVMSGR